MWLSIALATGTGIGIGTGTGKWNGLPASLPTRELAGLAGRLVGDTGQTKGCGRVGPPSVSESPFRNRRFSCRRGKEKVMDGCGWGGATGRVTLVGFCTHQEQHPLFSSIYRIRIM